MPEPAPLKSAIHAQCRAVIAERMADLEKGIADARLSAQSDTKSSAGDKHETGRAMAQLEVEKQQGALANLRRMQDVLDRLDPERANTLPAEGALLTTDAGVFYVAAALGRMRVAGQDVIVISAEAPLFGLFRTLRVGGSGVFQGKTYTLKAVV